MCRHIGVTPRRALTPAGEARICLNLHKRRIENFEFQPPAGKPIGVFQREIDLENGNAGDLHGVTTMLPVCCFAMKALWASCNSSRR